MGEFLFKHNQNAEYIHNPDEITKAPSWAGMYRFISFSTPEGEVKGVVPVKFMARKELIATLNKNSARKPAIP